VGWPARYHRGMTTCTPPVNAPLDVAVTLANGVAMPWLGLGTWRSAEGAEVEAAVRTALAVGYRHIDTAAVYRNETGVGRAIRESGVPREEIFLTTKVWNDAQREGPEAVRRAFDDSLAKLGVDTIDLYLVHWPVAGRWMDTWRVLEDLYEQGRCRAIGVSNFLVHHLEEMLPECRVRPMVDQVEFHPWLVQPELLALCEREGIRHEAWSPLMQGRFTELEPLADIAARVGRTPAQVLLRWNLQKGSVTIPKSVTPQRIRENAGILDFELAAEDVARIDGLDRGQRIGPHPDEIEF
jgi:diketogulonate reductase-like aldo/keto reductase